MRTAALSASLLVLTLATVASAEDTRQQEQAISRFVASLPPGWQIAQRDQNQYPWGHYFCSSHSGPLGTKIVFAGPKPVKVQWTTATGEERQTIVAQEALEVWFMPTDYSDSWLSWLCFSRPAQPIEVYSGNGVRVFARPAHRLYSESKFQQEVLTTAVAVRWPDSPGNNPALISWEGWEKYASNALVGK
ncbi:hypothetical protein [Ideonella paludis]|uniref:Uncharacterized protein n=1 Tax=Ideonella paludis TaxID=1233411 RepID=A0ABS5DYL2_9BURK|nr:hypothetical protein [Ideonella paludis]MBQ0935916.1 hypothetical protein [Ideonella paludis]